MGIAELPNDTVVDGEVVALTALGKPPFDLLEGFGTGTPLIVLVRIRLAHASLYREARQADPDQGEANSHGCLCGPAVARVHATGDIVTRLCGTIAYYDGSYVYRVLALFCLLIIGVVDWGKTFFPRVPFSAKRGSANQTKVVSIGYPAHHIESPVVTALPNERAFVPNLFQVAEGDGHGLARFQFLSQRITHTTFVRRLHREFALNRDAPAPAFLSGSDRAPDVHDIKLAADFVPRLEQRNLALDTGGPWRCYHDIAHHQFWPLRKNQRLLSDLGLLLSRLRIGARGFGRYLREFGLSPSSIEQPEGNESVGESNSENTPIGRTWSLVPFLCGLFLFYGGCLLNYLNWRWLDDDRKWPLGWVGFASTAAMMGSGLILMFFVAPAM